MKRTSIMMLLAFLFSSISVFGQSQSKENSLVEEVLSNMVNGRTMSVSKYVSPAYLKAHGINPSDYKINTYSPTDYVVDENKGNGVVSTRIMFSNGNANRLVFIVTFENGNYYLMPGRAPSTYFYVDPWHIVETNVTGGGSGGGGKSTTPTETESRKIVGDVLTHMIDRQSDFNENGSKYIAPSYYKAKNISKSDYKINSYTVTTYEITSVQSGGIVVALIYGSGKTWAHELTFKCVKEGGKVYVYPKGHTDNKYIHPWYEVETDVLEKRNNTKTVTKDEKTELVEKILYGMVYEKESFETDMQIYIAPSYYKANNLVPSVYKVNSYSPVGYSIESSRNGIVIAKIWGSDRGWVHELTFKVVTESGLLYVMPGEHYESVEYVDPWFSVRTSITE